MRFIDTDPDVNKHTPLCSCEFCLDMKRVIFKGCSQEFFATFKTSNPYLYEVLKTDGFIHES